MKRLCAYGLFGVVLLCAVGFAPAVLWGQANATGTITGQVTDPSGAVVVGAQVKIVDTATRTSWNVPTNSTGRYVVPNLPPGTYDISVTMKGFRQAQVTGQQVVVGQELSVNVTLELGLSTQTVEVKAVPGAELQTLNSTLGQSLVGETILSLPSVNRDVASLLTYSPTAQVTFNGAEGNVTGGGVGGQTSDENTYMLDGGNNTDDLAGNNGYVNGQNGTVSGSVPTPIESIEEFKVNTSNTTSDFSTSSGAQVLMTTKRGTNQFHGAGYDYLQSSVLDSNDWSNNFFGNPKPKTHSNRFGGALGGPLLPNIWGGKTYFFTMYEGNRYPRSGPVEKVVPTALMREGILQFKDGGGNIIQYNLATSMQCGAAGNAVCDPRGIGIAPVVSQLWSTYMPLPTEVDGSGNCVNGGDKLNTCNARGNLTYPLADNFMVARVDHDFGPKWRWMASYRWFDESNPTTSQVDWGGLLPGHKLGQPASASNNVLAPRYFVTGLTTTLTPSMTNEFHFNFVRNNWIWIRAGATPQISGIPGALEVGGESTSALIPMNVDTQNARARVWDGHDSDYRETLSWLKGNHFMQFGGEMMHQWLHFDRYDNIVGGLTQLGYEINNSGVTMPKAYEPMLCAGSSATNCLPKSKAGTWAKDYADLVGIVDNASVVATRSGASLTANPIGTPLHSYDIVDNYNLYFSDAWKVKPNLTVTYGVNWGVGMPPYETNGEQTLMVSGGSPLSPEAYLANSLGAQNNGQTYNPTLGWTPIQALKMKYPYKPYYGSFGPRISAAWSPNADSGILGALLGHKATVIRGGYARIYDRSLPINFISGTVLGDGFLQSVSCTNPTSPAAQVGENPLPACAGPGVVDPTNAFRIGVDGKTIPLSIASTLPTPVQPGTTPGGANLNAPYATLVEGMSQNFRPGVSNQYDISVQRQLKHNMIVEVAYIGVWANHLYQGLDLGNVPLRMKVGGQTFQQAYDAIEKAFLAGGTAAPQPFFETVLAGTNNLAGSNYCAGYSSCTAAVVANNSGFNLPAQGVTNLFSSLDPYISYANGGPALVSDTQCFYCYTSTSLGFSNYNAGTVTLQKRTASGLTVNANLTYSRALGNAEYAQTYSLANPTDVQDLRNDYGPQYFDRKVVFNLLGTYQLPFGRGHRFGGSNGVLRRLTGGWAVSPIFSYGSGLPWEVYNDEYNETDQAYGQAYDGAGNSAVPVGIKTSRLSNSAHLGITSNGDVGSNADGYTGANLFGKSAALVFGSFRPPLPGIDGRSEQTGQIRGQPRWNLDIGFTKDTAITERVKTQLYVQMFNALNHMEWADPFNSLQDPADFGALESQYGVLNNSYTRLIQVGLRISF